MKYLTVAAVAFSLPLLYPDGRSGFTTEMIEVRVMLCACDLYVVVRCGRRGPWVFQVQQLGKGGRCAVLAVALKPSLLLSFSRALSSVE